MSTFLERIQKLSPKRLALLAAEQQARLETMERARREPIAVIGLGCRFPGDANDAASYWKLLRDGVDAIAEVPKDRWDIDAYYDPDPEAAGKMNTRWGGFIKNVDQFDPYFFGISPREAESMDPQQRLLLEVAWEALEHAGQAAEKLEQSKTGVFLGIASSDYSNLLIGCGPEFFDAYIATGGSHAIASGRLSYVLGLQGPSISLDTACSSSLVAVHLAVQSLRTGGCRMALAGGVNLMLSPEISITLSKASMLSPDGRCKTFDASANGFTRAEGAGLVVLKRLSDAIADGDNILAVIRGSAVNQDGRSSGITAPNGPSQEAVIQAALADAGLKPGDVGYIETHGTGTSLGDPIEAQALGAVFRDGHSAENPLLIGSVKTNFGHCEAAAGIAGLIKVVLSLQHKQLPPHLHVQTPSPYIPWQDLPLKIATSGGDWPAGNGRRVAGVSSFGFSGTNAHILLEEAPVPVESTATVSRPARQRLYSLSAKSEAALRELASRHAAQLGGLADEQFAAACFTANAGRSHFSHRLAVAAANSRELQQRLAAYAGGEKPAGLVDGVLASVRAPEVVFLFTGQGSQYTGMGRELFAAEPLFRETLQHCDALLRAHLDKPLLEVLFPADDGGELIHQTRYTQPALFALEYALATLWRSWGVEPAAVMGHSVGEYVAACVAGLFSLEDGLKLIAARGALMQELPQNGAMAAVFAPLAIVEQAIAPYRASVAVAATNGPENIVISGEQKAVAAILDELSAQEVKNKALTVSHAFHSPLMEPILDKFAAVAAQIEFHEPQFDLISNLTGEVASFDELRQPGYWRRHIREAVRFNESIAALHQQGYRVFLEIGPSPTLLSMGQRCLPEAAEMVWVPSLRKDKPDWPQMLESVARLYTCGVDFAWPALHRDEPPRRVVLPTYPFERQRYWLDEKKLQRARGARSFVAGEKAGHPLLGERLNLPIPTYQMRASRAALSMMDEHRAYGKSVVPGAIYLEIGLALTQTLFGSEQAVLSDLVLHDAIVLPEEDELTLQITVPEQDRHEATFRLYAYDETGKSSGQWRLHAEGRLRTAAGTTTDSTEEKLADIQARCRPADVEDLHQRLRRRGLQLQESFQSVGCLWSRDGEALGEIDVKEEIASQQSRYLLHPAIIDTCLSVLEMALPRPAARNGKRDSDPEAASYMLMGVSQCRMARRPGQKVWAHAMIHEPSSFGAKEVISGEVKLLDEGGREIASLTGLQFRKVTAASLAAARGEFSDWLHGIKWLPKPLLDAAGGLGALAPAFDSIAREVHQRIPALYNENGLQVYEQMQQDMDTLCAGYVIKALRDLGWDFPQGESITAAALQRKLGIQAQHNRLFVRLLEMLAEDGILAPQNGGWRVAKSPEPVDPASRLQDMLARFPACAAEIEITGRCGASLAGALTGNVDPLQLLFPDGSLEATEKLYQEAPAARTFNQILANAVREALHGISGKLGRPLCVLEIGAGTGGTTHHVLPALPQEHIEYVFTDVSQLFLARAQQKFAAYPFMSYRLLDISSDPAAQGFPEHGYDLIIAANVLHATPDLRKTLANVKSLLASDGLLVLLEGTTVQRFGDLTVGLTEGWWSFSDRELRPDYALLDRAGWRKLLQAMGFAEMIALPDGEAAHGPLGEEAVYLVRGPRRVAPERQPAAGTWLVFADSGAVGTALGTRLTESGHEVLYVRPAEAKPEKAGDGFVAGVSTPGAVKALIGELALQASAPLAGIAHLWSLDSEPFAQSDHAAVSHAQRLGSATLLEIVQALGELGQSPSPRLAVVTRGAQQVSESAEEVQPAQATLWGLGRVVALEHPELRCLRIDLDPAASPEVAAEWLAAEIVTADGEDQLAYRAGLRHAARLLPQLDREMDWQATQGLPVQADASYLITGGLAGLGLLTAEWLVQNGARHLILVSRGGARAESEAVLQRLRDAGAEVLVEQVDVGQRSQLEHLLQKVVATMPPLRGVIHSAGTLDDGVLLQQNWSRFERVFAAKVDGTWHLHDLTRELALDFFVFYSSGAALLGSSGQGNHAAANAFMDALAHFRRAQGLPALSINWGPWSEIGAAVEKAVDVKMLLQGMELIAPEQGLRILSRLLRVDCGQAGVLPINWPQVLKGYESGAEPPYFREIARRLQQQQHRPAAATAATAAAAAPNLLQQLRDAPPSKRRNLLMASVRQQVARVLGIDGSRPINGQQPLTDLGLDSLMAVELRNALSKTAGASLPATLLFEYPTLDALVDYLGRQVLAIEQADAPAPPAVEVPVAAASDEQLDDLSEDEMASLLEEKLQNLSGRRP